MFGDDDELVVNPPAPCQLDKHRQHRKSSYKKIRPASKGRTVEGTGCGLFVIAPDAHFPGLWGFGYFQGPGQVPSAKCPHPRQ